MTPTQTDRGKKGVEAHMSGLSSRGEREAGEASLADLENFLMDGNEDIDSIKARLASQGVDVHAFTERVQKLVADLSSSKAVERTYPNAGPDCDLGRYRTGEVPQVGDVVVLHGELISGVRDRHPEGNQTVAGIDGRCVWTKECRPATWAARFDLVSRVATSAVPVWTQEQLDEVKAEGQKLYEQFVLSAAPASEDDLLASIGSVTGNHPLPMTTLDLPASEPAEQASEPANRNECERLRGELEALTKRYLRLERDESEVMDSRDYAQEKLDIITSIILGEEINWSFHEGKWDEAIDRVAMLDVQKVLRQSPGDSGGTGEAEDVPDVSEVHGVGESDSVIRQLTNPAPSEPAAGPVITGVWKWLNTFHEFPNAPLRGRLKWTVTHADLEKLQSVIAPHLPQVQPSPPPPTLLEAARAFIDGFDWQLVESLGFIGDLIPGLNALRDAVRREDAIGKAGG